MDDLPHQAAGEPATLTVDRRRIDTPPQIGDRQGFTPGSDGASLVSTLRQRARWLRLQVRICVVVLAMLLAGGGVIFLDARTMALDEAPRPPPSAPGSNKTAIGKSASNEIYQARLRQDREAVATSRLRIANRVAMDVRLSRQRLGSFGADTSITSIWFTDPSHGWAAGINGTILLTIDGGATYWAERHHERFILRAVHRPAARLGGWGQGHDPDHR